MAGLVVAAAGLAVAPARAQTYIPWMTDQQVAEGAGSVEITINKGGPGHVRYQTADGSCEEDAALAGSTGPSSVASSCEPPAEAAQDYEAVRGDLVFTTAGTRTIRIPIVDDEVAERTEAFTFYAHEGDQAAGTWTGRSATIWITDDDVESAVVTTVAGPTNRSSTSAASGSVSAPSAGTPAGSTVAPRDVAVAVRSGELQPGPGFVLASGDVPVLPDDHERRGEGMAAWWTFGSAIVAVVAGGVLTWLQRRRRWSSSRA